MDGGDLRLLVRSSLAAEGVHRVCISTAELSTAELSTAELSKAELSTEVLCIKGYRYGGVPLLLHDWVQ